MANARQFLAARTAAWVKAGGGGYPVEYLIDDGGAYIDCGFPLNGDTDEVEAVFVTNNIAANIWGSRTSGTNDVFMCLIQGGGLTNQFRLGFGRYQAGRELMITKDKIVGRELRTVSSKDRRIVYADGVEVGSQGSFSDYIFTTPDNCFWCYISHNQPQGAGFCLDGLAKSFKVTRSGSVFVNLVAWVDKNGVPCFYDTVSNTKFYNQGSGTFTAGPRI